MRHAFQNDSGSTGRRSNASLSRIRPARQLPRNRRYGQAIPPISCAGILQPFSGSFFPAILADHLELLANGRTIGKNDAHVIQPIGQPLNIELMMAAMARMIGDHRLPDCIMHENRTDLL